MDILIPTITISHAVACENNKYLLVQELDHSWYLPAGKIHNTETVIEGTIREVKEESGLDCSVSGLINIEHTFINELDHSYARLVYIFEIELLGGQLKQLPDHETLQAEWFTLNEIMNLQLRSIALLEILENYEALKSVNKILPIKYFNAYVF